MLLGYGKDSNGLCVECTDNKFSATGKTCDVCHPLTEFCNISKTNGECVSNNIDKVKCQKCNQGYKLDVATGLCSACQAGENGEDGLSCTPCTKQQHCNNTLADTCVNYSITNVHEQKCQTCNQGFELDVTTGLCSRCQVGDNGNGLSCTPCPA
eukprot:Pgem_evm1s14401